MHFWFVDFYRKIVAQMKIIDNETSMNTEINENFSVALNVAIVSALVWFHIRDADIDAQ